MPKRSSSIKVGIVGLGAVGYPVYKYFSERKDFKRGVDLFLYDTDPAKGFNDDVNVADIIFVAVPTPSSIERRCDTSLVRETVKKIAPGKIVVIKSTVPAGTTERLQKMRPDLKLLFNPEFLTEKRAWEDFVKPDRQIVGFTENSYDAAFLVLSLLPKAPFMSPGGIDTYSPLRITATEAELIKYGSNVWFIRKLNLANALFLLSKKLAKRSGAEVDYDNVRFGLSADYRIGDSHLDVGHGGYRGWGGKCFPKDILSLIGQMKENDLDECVSLLESDFNFNIELLESQNISLEEVSSGVTSEPTAEEKTSAMIFNGQLVVGEAV